MNFDFKTADSITTADYKIGGQTLRLWVDRDILTPKKLREINEGIKQELRVETGMHAEVANTTAMAKTLDLVIQKWRAVNAQTGEEEKVEFNGKVVEPNFEFFDDRGIKFLSDILQFVMEQINPKQQTATP